MKYSGLPAPLNDENNLKIWAKSQGHIVAGNKHCLGVYYDTNVSEHPEHHFSSGSLFNIQNKMCIKNTIYFHYEPPLKGY